ncbi:MAG: glycosyltransferase family 4 protein [Candidatus Zambryskibacteria bacterium]|nr:glycosyltransferase family 4 protein [Candidatus Zambryskibacteria bacterium]
MNLRVLYLFAGPRRKLYEEYKKGKASDIHLVGFNHMVDYGIKATFLENRLTEFLRRISFNLTQLPVLFQLKSCDVIFSGSGILTLFIIKYLLRLKKPKWIIYNTYLSNSLKRNTGGLKGWVVKKAIFSADAIMSPSLAQQDFLRNIGFPAEKNYYVPYGVDHSIYDKDARVSEISERYILSTGRDVGRDYKTLIEAVRGLPIKLLISTFPRNLKDIGELPPNVSVSYLPRTAMPPLIKKAEFVIIPTIPEGKMAGSDCSGQYSLLESMSCSKAVITSARATLDGYFTTGQHGLIVAPENVAELREAIMLLWNDPQKAKTMGEAGRGNVKTHFTMEIFARKLAELFYEVAMR